MSFHFCSHVWEVRDVADGTVVTISDRDLDKDSVPVLVEDLVGLVLESGRPNLYLDFNSVRTLGSVTLGKMLALDNQLRSRGGRLAIVNLDPAIYPLFEAARLTGILDLRVKHTSYYQRGVPLRG